MTSAAIHWTVWLSCLAGCWLFAEALRRLGVRWYWFALLAVAAFIAGIGDLIDTAIRWGPIGRPEQITAMYAGSWPSKIVAWLAGLWPFFGAAFAGALARKPNNSFKGKPLRGSP